MSLPLRKLAATSRELTMKSILMSIKWETGKILMSLMLRNLKTHQLWICLSFQWELHSCWLNDPLWTFFNPLKNFNKFSIFCEEDEVFAKGAKNGVSHCFPLYQPLVTCPRTFLAKRKNDKTRRLCTPTSCLALVLTWPILGNTWPMPRNSWPIPRNTWTMLRNTWIISWSSWPILRITWPMFRNNWTIPRNTWPLLGNTCPMQRNTWPMSRNSWPMPINTWQMLRNTWTVDNLQKYPAMHRNSWPIRQEILGQLLEIPGQYLMLMPWNTCSTLGNSLAWIYFSGWTCP